MKYLILISSFLLYSCLQNKGVDNKVTMAPSINAPDFKACNLTTLKLNSKLGSPTNISEVIDLINALPRPVTLPCFLQALNRPLKVNATSSPFSAQPAQDPENPRLFIFNEKLIMSIVTSGPGSGLLELSYLYSDNVSLKGELPFPITAELNNDSPFKRIESDHRTTCSGCHFNESRDPSTISGYTSRAIKPGQKNDVPLSSFMQERYICAIQNENSYRCQLIRSLFDNGVLIQSYFPAGMNTFSL